MTANVTNGTNRPARRRRYRLAMYGVLAVGFVGYLAALRVDMPVAALGVYWVAFIGFLGIWKGSAVTIYDERHHALERSAWMRTIGVVCAVVIVVGPALPALGTAGYEPPALVLGALFGYAAMFGVYGAIYLVTRYWR